jgi:hypothetical protein
MTGLTEQLVNVKKDVNFVRPEGTRSRPSIGRTDLEGGEADKGVVSGKSCFDLSLSLIILQVETLSHITP